MSTKGRVSLSPCVFLIGKGTTGLLCVPTPGLRGFYEEGGCDSKANNCENLKKKKKQGCGCFLAGPLFQRLTSLTVTPGWEHKSDRKERSRQVLRENFRIHVFKFKGRVGEAATATWSQREVKPQSL